MIIAISFDTDTVYTAGSRHFLAQMPLRAGHFRITLQELEETLQTCSQSYSHESVSRITPHISARHARSLIISIFRLSPLCHFDDALRFIIELMPLLRYFRHFIIDYILAIDIDISLRLAFHIDFILLPLLIAIIILRFHFHY